MISKTNRFHGHNSLNFVYKTGKSVRTDFLSMRYARSRRSDYRLAIVVSKKVHKSAVVRNRIRRRLYEIVRLHKHESAEPWPYDMVISVFDERIAILPATELQQTVQKMLQKAGL